MNASLPPETDPSFPWAITLSIIAALITGAAGIYATRSGTAANRETVQLQGWKDLVTTTSEQVDKMRARQKEDEDQSREEIAECHMRIDDLTGRFLQAEKRERALVNWAKSVVNIMRRQGIAFPPPPPGVEDTDPNGASISTGQNGRH